MHREMFRDLSKSKISSSNHESWRNSNAARMDGNSRRNELRTSTSFLKVGGSWNRTGPSRSPKPVTTLQKYSRVSAQSFSLDQCVIFCGAFRAKRNFSGVNVFQFSIVFGAGIRWN